VRIVNLAVVFNSAPNFTCDGWVAAPYESSWLGQGMRFPMLSSQLNVQWC